MNYSDNRNKPNEINLRNLVLSCYFILSFTFSFVGVKGQLPPAERKHSLLNQ